MRTFFVSFALALAFLMTPAWAQKEPTSVQEYQLSAPPVVQPAPPNQSVRLLAYGVDGKPVFVILDGVTLTATNDRGTFVVSAAAPAARTQVFARRVVTVIVATAAQPTFSIPASGIFESLLVFRNGILQSAEHDYSVDAAARSITFLPTARVRERDIVNYFWLETQ